MHYPVSQSPGIPRLRLSPSTSAASAPDGGEESVRARLLTPRFSDGLLSKQTPGDAESSPAPFTSAARKHVSPGAYPPPRDRVTTGGRREAPLPRFFHARGESTNIPRAAARSFRACVNIPLEKSSRGVQMQISAKRGSASRRAVAPAS